MAIRASVTVLMLIPSSLCLARLETQQYVTIGGIEKWIQITGENEQNTVLLFLHGASGNSAMSYTHKFADELEKHSVMVLWNQRDTGKTP